jgi:hypothetical protein
MTDCKNKRTVSYACIGRGLLKAAIQSIIQNSLLHNNYLLNREYERYGTIVISLKILSHSVYNTFQMVQVYPQQTVQICWVYNRQFVHHMGVGHGNAVVFHHLTRS